DLARLRDAVKARYGFDVVVQNLRLGFDDDAQRFLVTLEVGREDLDAGAGRLQANLADDLGEALCRADVVVVAVYAGDDSVAESKLSDCVGHPARLVEVDRLGLAFGHGTEPAASGAQVAEHHEGGSLLIPALTDVGALRALVDGVQVQGAGELLQTVEGLAAGCAGVEPLGFAHGAVRREIDLDELDCGSRRHHLRLYRTGPL